MTTSVIQRWNNAVEYLTKKDSWFCSAHAAAPLLFVGGRVIHMPILNETFNALKAISSDAPFGKGSETVVDKTVRDALEISNTEITFDNSWHEDVLLKIVEEVGRAFNTKGLRAELYKMLLYERGGHFKPHRDTLRAPNHVASLIVSLPVDGGGCEGGELLVKGPGSENQTTMRWDGRCRGLQCSWAAFYTDCEHELLPLTEGRRVTLAYNLFVDPNALVLPAAKPIDVKSFEKRGYEMTPSVEVVPLEPIDEMKRLIDEVLTKREYVLIALDHYYGITVLPCFLKGRDRQVYETLYRLYGDRVELKQVEVYSRFYYEDEEEHDQSLDYAFSFLGDSRELFFSTFDYDTEIPRSYLRKDEPDILCSNKLTSQETVAAVAVAEEEEEEEEKKKEEECDVRLKTYFDSGKYAFFFNRDRFCRVADRISIEMLGEYTGNEASGEDNNYRHTLLRIGSSHCAQEKK